LSELWALPEDPGEETGSEEADKVLGGVFVSAIPQAELSLLQSAPMAFADTQTRVISAASQAYCKLVIP
jgi:hypothetical protein